MIFCGVCGETFDSKVEVRKHIFMHHYEHTLMRCGGDIENLKEWMELDQEQHNF
jgi:hypothetical protein